MNITKIKRYFNSNKVLHRLEGPALEYFDGELIYLKAWYYEGEQIECNSQEEFERLIKLKLFW